MFALFCCCQDHMEHVPSSEVFLLPDSQQAGRMGDMGQFPALVQDVQIPDANLQNLNSPFPSSTKKKGDTLFEGALPFWRAFKPHKKMVVGWFGRDRPSNSFPNDITLGSRFPRQVSYQSTEGTARVSQHNDARVSHGFAAFSGPAHRLEWPGHDTSAFSWVREELSFGKQEFISSKINWYKLDVTWQGIFWEALAVDF